MKRVLTFLAIMLLPLSVMAMTPVTDSTLSDVTGQAGVNINADLAMNISIGTLAWGDSTGLDIGLCGVSGWVSTDGPNPGYIGVTGLEIQNLRIKARESDSYDSYTTAQLKPITIDVATGPKQALNNANATFVRFGLGSLQITLDSLELDVMAGQTVAMGQQLGTVGIGDVKVYIDPVSYVDIYAHSGVGVNFDINVELDYFDIEYLSWGDEDGLNDVAHVGEGTVTWIAATGQDAGYIGLRDLEIGGPITVNGTVSIDVVTTTDSGSAYNHDGAYATNTIVHISFGGPHADNFSIGVGTITANVALGEYIDLTSARDQVLGDIYIGNFDVTIDNNSWVDIWAH